MDAPALLQLSSPPITFEGLSLVNSVFYDDICKQVFAVRSGGAMGVVVKGPEERLSHTFRMEDRGPILAIKFSLDQAVLAVQRFPDSVGFTNFRKGELVGSEYVQMCRGRNTQIRGFIWTSGSKEILFITNNGIEFYSVNSDKRSVKLVKSHSFTVNWYLYNPATSTLLLCVGNPGNSLQPFLIRGGAVFKLPKIDLDLSATGGKALSDRDVVLAEIYRQNCLAIFKHQPRGTSSIGGELVIFVLNKDSTPTKKHVLKIDRGGKLAVNIVDNLVVIHHQNSKTSQIFDIFLPGETDGYVVYHDPIVYTRVSASIEDDPEGYVNDIYGQNGLIFQPDVIIDAKVGRLWIVRCNLSGASKLIDNWSCLVNFLLSRNSAKAAVLDVLRQMLLSDCPLSEVGKIFDLIVEIYQAQWHLTIHPQVFGKPKDPSSSPTLGRQVIDQKDMCMLVFTSVMNSLTTTIKFSDDCRGSRFSSVLIEYVRSLHQHFISVEYFVLELLATTLIRDRAFQQLHQLLQYGTIRDSKQMACLLLSLTNEYPPAEQIALDMLKRLNEANEQIVEILLNKGLVFTALRFLQRLGLLEATNTRLDVRKFLEAALVSNDRMIFYAVFKFFEQRNIKLRGSTAFAAGDQCEVYVKKFEELFGQRANSG